MTDYVIITFYQPSNPPMFKGFKNEENARIFQHGCKAILEQKALYAFRYSYGQCVETIQLFD